MCSFWLFETKGYFGQVNNFSDFYRLISETGSLIHNHQANYNFKLTIK